MKAAVPLGLPGGRALTLIAVVAACLFGFSASASAAIDTVTSESDTGPGSLRTVIENANNGDTIAFDAGLDGKTINLTSGAIAIDKSLTIEGPGASHLTVDAGHSSQIFTVSAGSLSISGLALTHGAASANGGAIDDTGAGSLTVSDCTFTANTAGGDGGAGEASGGGWGGAIYVAPSTLSVSVTDSVFSANTAGGAGGGGFDSGRGTGGAIEDSSGGSLTITDSIFSGNAVGGQGGEGGNSGTGSGGAIDNGGSLTITNSTFSNNTVGGQGGIGNDSGSGSGGAIYNSFHVVSVTGSTFDSNTVGGDDGGGTHPVSSGGAIHVSASSLSVADSTLVGNAAGGSGAAGFGGAIQLSGNSSATLASVTMDANSVGSGGAGAGINDADLGTADVTARATIVSGNTGATNCDAHVVVTSYSLEGPSGDTSCGFDLPSANPQLEPFADNGGPTETQALPLLSPAVDAVPVAQCPTKVDQRGEPRPDNGESVCDVGAFELQDPPIAPAASIATPTDGATYMKGQIASVAFSCAEGAGGPGIASCVDQDGRPSGAALDTAATGNHTFTVIATSQDGLTGKASVTYTVVPAVPKGPAPPRPHVLVSYHQLGGIGGTRPSLVIFKDHHAKLTLGGCTARFTLSQAAWSRLRAALRSAHLHVIAGDYPPPPGAADEITYVIKARGEVVRIAPPQPKHEEVIRALRPLLKVLNKTVSAGERRMSPSCKSNSMRATRSW